MGNLVLGTSRMGRRSVFSKGVGNGVADAGFIVAFETVDREWLERVSGSCIVYGSTRWHLCVLGGGQSGKLKVGSTENIIPVRLPW